MYRGFVGCLSTRPPPHCLQVDVRWGGAIVLGVRYASPHTELWVPTQVGEGLGVNISVSVGGQWVGGTPLATALTLAYARPRVTRLTILRGPGDVMDCSVPSPEGRPLPGAVTSATVLIEGVNFGLGTTTSVRVRDTPCAISNVTQASIVCETVVCSGKLPRTLAVKDMCSLCTSLSPNNAPMASSCNHCLCYQQALKLRGLACCRC
jgi:hypothetical protein